MINVRYKYSDQKGGFYRKKPQGTPLCGRLIFIPERTVPITLSRGIIMIILGKRPTVFIIRGGNDH